MPCRKIGFFAMIAMICLATPCVLRAAAKNQGPDAATHISKADIASSASRLPPLPAGKTTVIGGSIREIDPVRDEIHLKVFGGNSMKILFDARTHFYRNGERAPLRDLKAGEHASIETVLDGSHVFARTIHVLSTAPEGQTQGQVVSYNSQSGDLTISPALTREPIALKVPAGTPIVRVGQHASAPEQAGQPILERGTLVSITFQSANDGKGIARRIEVLAAPGENFQFAGAIVFLDMHSHQLAMQDSQDGNTYKISFNPSLFPSSRQWHRGDRIKVNATFNGSGYVANSITAL